MINPENCRITHYPKEVLATPAEPIEEIDENIRAIAQKMIDLMVANNGIGLAGPQAGVGLRIFVVSLDVSRENARVYINPEVEPAGQLEAAEEGCLSVPGVYPKIRRYSQATVTATDLDGRQFTEKAEGLYARCLQHEYDHLQGKTIVSRMGQTAKIKYRSQLKRLKNSQNSS